MAKGFIGRAAELAALHKRLDQVNKTGSGRALAIRGRRQVGKSRLAQEFCDQAKVPYLFFTAIKGASPVESVTAFLGELARSSVPTDAELIPSRSPGGWPDTFRTLASVLPDKPSIVVLDELPWLSEQDPLFDGSMQATWDRLLSGRPVLLLLLGSDIHMMERLTAYDRPFFGRADNLVLGPLNPAETAEAVSLDAADAIDAYLISGGLPSILRTWSPRTSPEEFIKQECEDPASPLFSVPESVLLAEFPLPDQTRRVLEAIGSGDRTHANIAATAGSSRGALPSGALSPLLRRLVEDKRVLAVDEPLSTRPSKPVLYRIADPNLRLYLAALRPAQEQIRRGRANAAFTLIQQRWPAWRGRAVEPLVRESLELAMTVGAMGTLTRDSEPVPPSNGVARTVEDDTNVVSWEGVVAVGGWWNRQFNPEVDLVGADQAPVARKLYFVGSIKWLSSPFDHHDMRELMQTSPQVPGFVPGKTGLVAVSLNGTSQHPSLNQLDLIWTPADIISAWRQT